MFRKARSFITGPTRAATASLTTAARPNRSRLLPAQRHKPRSLSTRLKEHRPSLDWYREPVREPFQATAKSSEALLPVAEHSAGQKREDMKPWTKHSLPAA